MINEGCSSVVALALQRSSGLHLSWGDCPQSACFNPVSPTGGRLVAIKSRSWTLSGEVKWPYILTKSKIDKYDALRCYYTTTSLIIQSLLTVHYLSTSHSFHFFLPFPSAWYANWAVTIICRQGFFLVLLLIAALESCVCLSHSPPLLTHKYLIRSQLLKRRRNMTAGVLIGARGGFVGAAESRLHLMHVSLWVQRRGRPSEKVLRSARLPAA